MLPTPLGMSIDVMGHPSNAEFPITDTVLGIMVFLQPNISLSVAVSIMALQLFRESHIGFPAATEIVCKFPL